MKGLLLKDCYQFLKYSKIIIFIVLFFAGLSAFDADNMFIVIYPCIFACNVTMSLIAYDEHDKWDLYSLSLPYTKADLVSAKYLFGLFFGFGVTFLMLAVQIIRLVVTDTFSVAGLITLLSILLLVSFLPSAVQLLVVYRYGTGKGRIVFLASVAILCGAIYGFWGNAGSLTSSLPFLSSLPVISLGLAALFVYGISWILAIKIYEKKEF